MRFLATCFVLILVTLACGNASDDDGGSSSAATHDKKIAACRQVFEATCDTLARCGGIPPDTDCAATTRAATADDLSDCTADIVDDFTQSQVDTCSADMEAFPCDSLCDVVPEDPPSCHALSPKPNTEVIACTY